MLQVRKVRHINLVLYVLKHSLGMVSDFRLAVLDEGCQRIVLLCVSGGGGLSPGAGFNHEKDELLTWDKGRCGQW